MIDSMHWYGPLTLGNLNDVASALRERLTGKVYTRTARVGEVVKSAYRAGCEQRMLVPHDKDRGPVIAWFRTDGTDSNGGIMIADDDLRHTDLSGLRIATLDHPTISFGATISIEIDWTAKQRLTWTIEIEEDGHAH